MKVQPKLRIFRIIVAILSLALIILAFFDYEGKWSSSFFRSILFLQFVPSFLQFVHFPSIFATGFILVILLTFLFGRVYCSWICPLGILQDGLRKLKPHKRKRRNRYKFYKTNKWLKYSVLTLSFVSILFGSAFFLRFVDPYSLFGKLIYQLGSPVVIGANNLVFNILQYMGNYSLKPLPFPSFHLWVFVFSIGVLGILIFLVFWRGRVYCTEWCPVGTLLGVVSKFSIFKLQISENSCTSCGLCARNCKAGCIETKLKTIDFERCVGCFNCLSICTTQAIVFRRRWGKISENDLYQPDLQRRKILGLLIAATAGLGLKSAMAQTNAGAKALLPNPKPNPVTPPGSLSIEHFNNSCTACHLCISACPTKVLQPALFQYGLNGLFQPYLDFHKNFCNYDCVRCGEVCPTGAIVQLIPEDKKLIQIGRAHFLRENCVVYTEETACGACSEHCPTKAVHMVPYKAGLTIPEVNQNICVGCGACEYACPTIPNKAIYIAANPVHLKALPTEKSNEILEEIPEEFPF
jgi:polyferredoxin